MSQRLSRRRFAAVAIPLAACGIASLKPSRALAVSPEDAAPFVRPGDVVLFQGDSITDGGRDRSAAQKNDLGALGNGYVRFVSAQILLHGLEADCAIYNRGVGGNTVQDLASRWQVDCLELKPNVISILVGVNDLVRTARGTYQGGLQRYAQDYRGLLERTVEAIPDVRLIIGEPFLLKGANVSQEWVNNCEEFREVARNLADEFAATFVPYQERFDAATKIAPPEDWASDSIHPSQVGKVMMATWWLEAAGLLRVAR